MTLSTLQAPCINCFVQAESNGAPGMKIIQILKFAPLPDFIKNTLIAQLTSVCHTILADKIVFMLMLMMIVFNNDDNDSSISHIKDQYSNMLR